MPLNCLGNEVESGCVTWSGPDIPTLGIRFGDSLDDVILKIVAGIGTPTVVDDSAMSTDNITSRATIRSAGSVNASKIIKRDFSYSLTAASGASILKWDLVPVIRQLPPGYTAALTKVKVTGKATNTGNLIVDSRSPSASLPIAIDRYPVTLDIGIRVTTPDSGNIDLEKSIELVNPSVTGSFRANLDVNDLNPQSGEMLLTDHLNIIEEQLHNQAIRLDSIPDLSVDVETQKLEVESLKSKVESPSTLTVDYTKDGANLSAEVKTLVTDLYAQINSLKEKNASHQEELANLRTQVDSLA